MANPLSKAVGQIVQPSAIVTTNPLQGEVVVLRDTKALAANIEFFPAVKTTTKHHESAYHGNPRYGDRGLLIKSIGFGLNAFVVKLDAADVAATAAEIETLMNNLGTGSFEISAGEQSCGEQVHALATGFLSFDYDIKYLAATVALIQVHPTPTIALPEVVVVEPNQRLEVNVTFDATGGFAAANATGTTGNTLSLTCTVGAVEVAGDMPAQVKNLQAQSKRPGMGMQQLAGMLQILLQRQNRPTGPVAPSTALD